ncbi:hypothetical protein FPRO04_12743 [Fusarium proliferatum]|nr:hypothetical protein FPRO04_12743 [Fusarium proliferatum]
MNIPDQSIYHPSSLNATESCQTCREFFNFFYESEDYAWKNQYRICDWNERKRIQESKLRGCQLCLKIFYFLKQRYGPGYDDEHAENEKFKRDLCESRLLSDTDIRRSNRKRSQGCISLVRFDWGEGFQPLCFSVWAKESMTPSQPNAWMTANILDGFSTTESEITLDTRETPYEMVKWPPVFYNNPADVCSLVQRFMNNCSDHIECSLEKEPLQDEDSTELWEVFELPSRVLCLKDDAGHDVVKLFETKGSRGTYCALSHCWGPQGKHPLRTTKANLEEHVANIPWSSVPRTFRDAIELIRGLGIKYLWIDSLCIIQDDDSDWNCEARKMASVYQRAALVIAAAGANDSTEGLFISKRPKPEYFSLPNTSSDGHVVSTYVAEAPHDTTEWGIGGPLEERGWVFQEWYLGRRRVFFTSEGIKWKCREDEMNERAVWVHLGMIESTSWTNCLKTYSGKKLTIPTDRTKALLGVATEFGKRREDSFREDLSTWEDGLANQLLWRQIEEPHDRIGLPSWCWAATGGEKFWLLLNTGVDMGEAVFGGIPQMVKLTKTQSLSATGHLIRVMTGPRLENCCYNNMRRAFNMEELTMVLDGMGVPYKIPRFPVIDAEEEGSILGLAVRDFNCSGSECFTFILGQEEVMWHAE